MANKTRQPAAPVATLEHETSSFERFLEENLKTLLVGGVVIFIGIIGYLIFLHLSESSAAEEANAFTAAESVEDYREVISNHPGTLAAGNAQLMIGKSLAEDDEKKQEAIAAFRTFVESYTDHPLRAQGMFELASLLLADDQKSDAIVQIDKLIAEYPESHLAPYAKLCKGDFAYEEGNKEAAQKIYSDVLIKHSGTEAAKLAEQRADRAKIDPPEIVAPRPEPLPDDGGGTPTPGVGAPTPFILDPDAIEGDSETDAAADAPDAAPDAADAAPDAATDAAGDAAGDAPGAAADAPDAPDTPDAPDAPGESEQPETPAPDAE